MPSEPLRRVASRRDGAALTVTGSDKAGHADQSGDALAAVPLAPSPQGGMDPRRPIGFARGHVHILHPREQRPVCHLTG